jgi:L-lactate dehydrogenase complex protein LldG
MRQANPMASLTALFEANAKEAAADVLRVGNSPERVRSAVQQAAAGARVIVLGVGEFLPANILASLREVPGVIPEPSDEQLATAQVGVSGAFAGVASSGSVCIVMGPPLAAAASLLMPLHIVILAANRIVERPRDVLDSSHLGGQGLSRNLVFVTGPSATADMGPLVRGVHGPHRLQILLLSDVHGH